MVKTLEDYCKKATTIAGKIQFCKDGCAYAHITFADGYACYLENYLNKIENESMKAQLKYKGSHKKEY